MSDRCGDRSVWKGCARPKGHGGGHCDDISDAIANSPEKPATPPSPSDRPTQQVAAEGPVLTEVRRRHAGLVERRRGCLFAQDLLWVNGAQSALSELGDWLKTNEHTPATQQVAGGEGLLKAAQNVINVWGHQVARVFEAMGDDNPRADAIDRTVLDLNDAVDASRRHLTEGAREEGRREGLLAASVALEEVSAIGGRGAYNDGFRDAVAACRHAVALLEKP